MIVYLVRRAPIVKKVKLQSTVLKVHSVREDRRILNYVLDSSTIQILKELTKDHVYLALVDIIVLWKVLEL